MKKSSLFQFLAGRFLGMLGDQFMLYVVPLLAYQSTGSIATAGTVFFIEWTPRILSLPFAGVLCDRIGGRRIYLASDLARGLACLAAFFALAAAPDAIFLILSLLVGFVAFFNSQAFVALESTLPKLVSREELPRAQSILQGADQICLILGPLTATLCAQFMSKESLFLPVALAFLLGFANLLMLRDLDLGAGSGRSRSVLGDLKLGLDTLLARPMLFRVIALTWLANLMIGTMLAISAAITTGVFQKSDKFFGLLNTITGCVAVATFFLIPRLVARISIVRLGVLAFILMIGGAFCAGLSPHFAGFALGYMVLFGSVGVFNVFLRTERARIIPLEHLGKTMGIVVLLNNASLPLSGLLLGLGVAEAVGPQYFIVALAVTIAAPAVLLLPHITREATHANSHPA